MPANASYNNATKRLAVSADNLPGPVSRGTFPNQNNTNTVTEQDFDHEFLYRGGTFGVTRTFDSNAWTQTGFIRSITLSVADNALFGVNNQIRSGDHLFFVFSDGIKRKFLFTGTTFTSIADRCWLAADNRLDLIMTNQAASTGTYTYYDQRNGRSATPLGAIGIAANGVVLFNPSAGTAANPPFGFNWNTYRQDSTTPINFGEDTCGGRPDVTGQYHYQDSSILTCWRTSGAMSTYNDYYGSSQYNGDNIRHPDGHSKIIGFSFDGFPIYGPYAYNSPWDNLSGVKYLTSSFEIRNTEVSGRPQYGATLQNPPAGSLMQDWRYEEGLGDLDIHNGRFCITPEYQDGTYAYFISIDSNGKPAFPYIIGTSTRETIDPPPGNGARAPELPPPPPPPDYVRPTLQFTLQPQNATVNANQSVTFTVQGQVVTSEAATSIGYQWFRSTDGGFAFAAITGATNSTYTITALAYMTGYRYRCRITGPLGVPTNRTASNSPLDSNTAVLTVTGGGDGGSLNNRFDSSSSRFDSTSQRFDGT